MNETTRLLKIKWTPRSVTVPLPRIPLRVVSVWEEMEFGKRMIPAFQWNTRNGQPEANDGTRWRIQDDDLALVPPPDRYMDLIVKIEDYS